MVNCGETSIIPWKTFKEVLTPTENVKIRKIKVTINKIKLNHVINNKIFNVGWEANI